jgi:hypothetical protein
LYKYFPSIPWYGLTIYFIAYLGVSLLVNVVIRNTVRDKFSLFLSIPAFLTFFTHCFSLIDFTTASLLMEFGVLISLLEWQISEKTPIKRSRLYGSLLTLCFLLSLVLRWQLVLFSLVFGFPSLLFLKKKQIGRLSRVIAIVLLFIVLDRTIFFLNTDAARTKEYTEFDKLRIEFFDTARGDYHAKITPNALKTVGWTVDDFQFFRMWNLYDERLFNIHTLKVFLEENNPVRLGLVSKFWERFKSAFIFGRQFNYIFIFTVLALLFCRFDNLINLSKKYRLKAIVSLCVLLMAAILLMIIRYKIHVIVPLYAYLICVLLLLSQSNESSDKIKRYAFLKSFFMIISSLLFLATIGLSYAQWKQDSTYLTSSKSEKIYIQYCLRVVNKQYSSPPLLVLLSPVFYLSLGTEKVHPLKEYSDFPTLRIFPSAWQVNSPRYFSILHQMNLNSGHDFLTWAVKRQDVLFVLFGRNEKINQSIKHLWESYINRNIMPNSYLTLTPVYDFRINQGYGLIFYRWQISQQ